MTVVGVNEFTVKEKVPIEILRVDPTVEERQVKKLKIVKNKRDNKKVKKILSRLHQAADRDVNLMPLILQAVKEYATLEEICNVLRKVFGEYRAPSII